MAAGDMRDGLYQALITRDLQAFLDQHQGSDQRGRIDDADLAQRLSRHLADRFQRRLHAVRDPGERVALANALLRTIEDHDDVVVPAGELLSLRAAATGPAIQERHQQRPRTPLNDAALLTNAPDEPSLAHELRAEIDSADRIDLLCAFVMWRGVRLLDEPLRRAREAGVPLRILTTTYIGGTERQALDRLIRDYGAEVKVQYDAARTRLHAKAWLFHRDTGFHTAYVGSSNLSTSALLEGVEWNVRLAQATTPSLLQKFRATFDSYWDSADFEPYDPERDRDRLDDALNAAAGRRGTGSVTISISGLQVRPFPFQQEMLEALTAEREVHGRHRNLVVAATGTGKTVVAALDYRGLCEQARTQPTLLFVAHRREILEQSLRTYREVLTDANFGELYVGNARPERWQHVFASVQSLTAYGVENIPADAFEVVVIDEFHHAEARTYRRLIEHLTPRELLGLTATPERADGVDVREFFDGRTATELRLWDALGADLLCPFHYFAIADGTDLRDVRWTRGRYDGDQLDRLYTGNDRRAAIVLKELHDKVADVGSMRALGFCVSVDHADYMARVFNAAGVAARAVSGTTSKTARDEALIDLRAGRVKVLFTVDLFNEGLDVPDVETVLFLRPTESATVFLQQLGRGLRRTPGKAVLTVLDFVGHHRKEFQFANRYRALTGGTRRQVLRQVEGGFPFLPSGCQIVLDRQSRELVLDNIRSQVGRRWSQIVSELRSYGDQDLPTFLDESGLELSDILRQGRSSWTGLRRDAGLETAAGSVLEERLLRRVRAFAHVDDPVRARAYAELLADDAPSYDALSPLEQRLARMLFFSLWPDGGGHESYGAALAALRAERATRAEIAAVADLSFDASRHLTVGLPREAASIPLQVHGRYQREEILAAIDYATLRRRPTSVMQGVVYSEATNVDAFFITLKKSEADYSPTTMYRDYPISPELFHWESQSTTTIASPTGKRYLSGTSTVLLFVRQEQKDDLGTSPYLFLGPATYVSHQGEKPIAITWRLLTPMPTDFFHQAAPIAQ